MQIFFDIITILFLCIVIAILATALLSVVFIVLYLIFVIIKVIICDYIIPSIKDYKLKRRIKKQTKNIKEDN